MLSEVIFLMAVLTKDQMNLAADYGHKQTVVSIYTEQNQKYIMRRKYEKKRKEIKKQQQRTIMVIRK